MSNKHKFYLTASITPEQATDELKQEVASVINLPDEKDKQPDLSYFSAILVSSGENLNHAYFLGSELVAAADTVVSKALDVEHEEQDIIGHLYSSAFTNAKGIKLNLDELASIETATLDTQDMHIQCGAVVYKNRFPEISKEIANNDWKISMECYFTDFDIKVGDTIIPKDAASTIGIDIDSNIFGKKAVVKKDGKDVANGTVARVLRGICFSGAGIVKNPANPPSVILETAKEDEEIKTLVFDLDLLDKEESSIKKSAKKEETINVTFKEVEDKLEKEDSELTYNDTIGICVNYKKRLEDKEGSVLYENWCTEFETSCTTLGGDATDQACLRNEVLQKAALYTQDLFKSKYTEDTTEKSLVRLQTALNKAGEVI